MAARLIEKCGMFMGFHKQGDHEPYFFVGLNNWLIEQCGGRWDYPLPIDDLLLDPALVELVNRYLRESLRSPRAISYFGLRRYLEYRSSETLSEPWGFKDPRLTFTLPYWREIFPNLRVVCISRHGVDVAASLQRRHQRIVALRRKKYLAAGSIYQLWSKRSGFSTSPRCASLESGLALWRDYCERADRIAQSGVPFLQVRYEDLLTKPHTQLRQLTDFAQLDVTDDKISDAVGHIDPARAFAYRKSAELVDFATEHTPLLRLMGYSDSPGVAA